VTHTLINGSYILLTTAGLC